MQETFLVIQDSWRFGQTQVQKKRDRTLNLLNYCRQRLHTETHLGRVHPRSRLYGYELFLIK